LSIIAVDMDAVSPFEGKRTVLSRHSEGPSLAWVSPSNTILYRGSKERNELQREGCKNTIRLVLLTARLMSSSNSVTVQILDKEYSII
ncbi:hypothetical protein Q5O12_26895, partial [Klebsiella pneumoniae]|uniref:hypothetical protein n=1 Tax=Klebsiella pneumoniae TaxID=573 RepID=UPI002747BC92|nr:hypothetical protein [Klebsiella pneumoniae]